MRQLSAERKITILLLKIADCEIPVILNEIYRADFTQDYQAGLQKVVDALVGDDT